MGIHLRTLTPLWTGGVDQTCDRLHETGLIGSLRWWYEALVRGLGGYACDPTSEDRCEYDPKKPDPPEKQLCAACYLFGCTGWARKFRLNVSSEGQKWLEKNPQDFLIPSGRIHQTKKSDNRAGGWFVFSESRVGEIVLEFTPLRDADLRPIHTILALISRRASLGPKGASGYGVIDAKGLEADLSWINEFGNKSPARNNILPDFRDFFFAKIQFHAPTEDPKWWQQINGIQQAYEGKLNDDTSPRPLRKASTELDQMFQGGILPIAPAIRNWLRYKWHSGLSPAETHFVFGEAQAVCPHCYQPGFRQDNKHREKNWCPHCKKSFKKDEEVPTTAAKICISYAYRLQNNQWEFRIWGWLPCKGKLSNRDGFLDRLHDAFQGSDLATSVFGSQNVNLQMTEWYSLDCTKQNGHSYLQQLIGGAQ